MRVFALVLGLLMLASVAFADVYVQGYTRDNGTYVAPHYRSSPNSSQYDNYSTKGNYNPYTGQEGTRNPNSTSPFSHQQQYKSIY